MEQIIHYLKHSSHILLTTHINPDGDAIGSLTAMGILLDKLHKKTVLYNESSVPSVYSFLPLVNRVEQNIGSANIYDVAIVLDCGDLQRVGKACSIIERIPVVINIDHHSSNDGFGDAQLVDVNACATTEIVYRLFKKVGVPINQDAAASIYTGILTDTGSFCFSNTNETSFAIAKEMVKLGVEPCVIARHIYESNSFERMKLLGFALDSIEIFYNGTISMMTITRDMLVKSGASREDTTGIVNHAKSIRGVNTAILIQEIINNHSRKKSSRFHVSLRSNGAVDVAVIASSFGGGGHANAAGFTIEAKLPEIKSKIMDCFQRL